MQFPQRLPTEEGGVVFRLTVLFGTPADSSEYSGVQQGDRGWSSIFQTQAHNKNILSPAQWSADQLKSWCPHLHVALRVIEIRYQIIRLMLLTQIEAELLHRMNHSASWGWIRTRVSPRGSGDPTICVIIYCLPGRRPGVQPRHTDRGNSCIPRGTRATAPGAPCLTHTRVRGCTVELECEPQKGESKCNKQETAWRQDFWPFNPKVLNKN